MGIFAEDDEVYFDRVRVMFADYYYGFKNIKTGEIFGHFYSATNFKNGYTKVRNSENGRIIYLDTFGHEGDDTFKDPITGNVVAICFDKEGISEKSINSLKEYLNLCPTLFTKLPTAVADDKENVKVLYNIVKRSLRLHLQTLRFREELEDSEVDKIEENLTKIKNAYGEYVGTQIDRVDTQKLDIPNRSNLSKIEEQIFNM